MRLFYLAVILSQGNMEMKLVMFYDAENKLMKTKLHADAVIAFRWKEISTRVLRDYFFFFSNIKPHTRKIYEKDYKCLSAPNANY